MGFKSIKFYTLRKVVEWLLGGELFNYILQIVDTLDREDLPGEEKRKKAQELVKKAFGRTAKFLVNLGIEVAVAYLRYKKEQIPVINKL